MTDRRRTTDLPGGLHGDLPGDPSPPDVAKKRRCLRCSQSFESKWAGERICARCKGTTAWRAGAPIPSRAIQGRG